MTDTGAMLTVLLALQLHVVQPPPDYRLWQYRIENPVTGLEGGLMQPRIAFHAEYAIGSVLLAKALQKVHVPPIITVLSIAVVPHILGGVIQKRYPINPGDWVFDAWKMSLPLVHTTKVRWRWLAGYAVLSGYGSP